jgi:putative transposase
LQSVREMAASESVHERTVYRWLRDGVPVVKEPRPLQVEMIRLFAECRANIARTHARAVREFGYELCQRHFARQIHASLSRADIEMLRTGEEGFRRFTVFLRWEAQHRNQIWEADAWQAPVWVRVKRGRREFKPWMVVIIDAYSRAILSIIPIGGRPTQANVLAALYQAIVRDEGDLFYGLPDVVRWDNGLEFLGDAVTALAAKLDFIARPVAAWKPYLKGKVERALRTLELQLASTLPGYLRGPRALDQTLMDLTGPALTLDQFTDVLATYILEYNHEHQHAALGGRTPAEAWSDDPTPLREVDPPELRWMLPRTSAKITKSGIRYRKRWYFAPEISGHVGERVEVAYAPGSGRRIDVYRNEKWWTTAIAQDSLTRAEARVGVDRRREAHDWIVEIAKEANRKIRAKYTSTDGTSDGEPAADEPNGQPPDGADALRADLDRNLRAAARTNLLGLSDEVVPVDGVP